MYLFGYSLDNLSLMALTIATGFVVDDAIVVMENIARHLEAGMKPVRRGAEGRRRRSGSPSSRSASRSSRSSSRILLMGGIVGRLFREFAVTLSTAIVVSMVVSLTTTPMMCAYLLHSPASGSARPRSTRSSESVLRRRALASTGAPCAGCSPGRRSTLVVLVLDDRAERGARREDSEGVLPAGGHRRARRGGAGAAGRVVPGRWTSAMRQIGDVIKSDPAVENVIAFTGTSGATNTGSSSSRSSRSSERKDRAPRGDRPPAPAARPPAGRVGVPPGGAGPAHRRPREQRACTSTRSRATTWRTSPTWGPVLLERDEGACPGLQDVSSDQQNGGLGGAARLRPRRPPRSSASPRSRSTRRSTTPSGRRRCRSSTRRSISTTSSSRSPRSTGRARRA